MLENPQVLILIEVVVAMLLGATIGFEREVAAKPAGLRTHMLVAGAATLFVGLGNTMTERSAADFAGNVLSSDPVRIVEAIVAGISFLGAGTIIRSRGAERVEGLTTAASLLLVAAIGVAVALQMYIVAVGVTVLSLLVLTGLLQVEKLAERLRDKREREN